MPKTSPHDQAAACAHTAPAPWWLWPQILSLDAPAVIVLWQLALAHTHRIHLPAAFYWGLGLVTWLIYVMDRTADALSGRLCPPLSQRHAFYLRHHKAVLGLCVPMLIALISWLALWQMPAGIIWEGAAMALLGTTYLACFSARPASRFHSLLVVCSMAIGVMLVIPLSISVGMKVCMTLVLCSAMSFAAVRKLDSRWRAWVPKEVAAAVLIALGCSVGVHFWAADSHPVFCTEVNLFASLCLLNLLSIAASEQAARLHADPESLFSSKPGLSATQPWLAAGLVVASLWIAGTTIHTNQTPGVVATAVAVAIASLLHGCLHRYAARLSPELYHLLADAAMILPLPVLFGLMPK